ncbi:hypothetical protein [Actinomadura litoris]|uniref:Uncharacterized protein n=1 Tax=Actinomadura litoris TaxID=2678616 RepID=A0A7K1L999_9ACTN|nr:hypothetical protein [Actinomadura litoris]MUN40913.1 hypothetical protein [Actinomadura litoris]
MTISTPVPSTWESVTAQGTPLGKNGWSLPTARKVRRNSAPSQNGDSHVQVSP